MIDTQSKYKKQFANLIETNSSPQLRGAAVLVEVLPKPELKTSGGIILADASKLQRGTTVEENRYEMGLVLMTGSDVSDEIKPGNIVLLPKAPMFLSEFPGLLGFTKNTLALIDDDAIVIKYEDAAHFERAVQALA